MTLTLTLIRGLPGSGKSTFAKTLPGKHLEADMYFIDEDGKYVYRPQEIALAHRWCQQQTEYWLAQGQSVVVANTFVCQWEMDVYRQLAERYQAQLIIHVCRGEFNNIHHVDAATIARMRKQWQE